MWDWVYCDYGRGVYGLYLPHDPDGTRVERQIPEGELNFVPTDHELLSMLRDAAERSILAA